MNKSYITVKNFAIESTVYGKMTELAKARGVPLTRLMRWVCHHWVDCGSPLIPEGVRAELERDCRILGISEDKLIAKIVSDWYGKDYSAADLISASPLAAEKSQKAIESKITSMWEAAILNENKKADKAPTSSANQLKNKL